jgi:hypothetical protein
MADSHSAPTSSPFKESIKAIVTDRIRARPSPEPAPGAADSHAVCCKAIPLRAARSQTPGPRSPATRTANSGRAGAHGPPTSWPSATSGASRGADGLCAAAARPPIPSSAERAKPACGACVWPAASGSAQSRVAVNELPISSADCPAGDQRWMR